MPIRSRLYDLVWSQQLKQIAKSFGISESVLAKRCSDVNVPVPPLDYWMRVEAGHPPQRLPLPKYRTAPESRANQAAQIVKQAVAPPSPPPDKSRYRPSAGRTQGGGVAASEMGTQAVPKERKAKHLSDAMLPYLRNAIEEPLKRKIKELRHTILELARDPELVYEALEKSMGESEPWVWQQQALKTIIARVTRGPLVKLPLPKVYRHMRSVIVMGHARAPCPLCGGGREPFTNQEDEANTIGTFSVPVGLERHLQGYGRIRQCLVMAAAHDLACEAWERKHHD